MCLKISLNSGLTIIMWATSKCDLFHNLPSTLWTFLSPKPLTFPETFLPELQNHGPNTSWNPGTLPSVSDLSRTFRRTFPEPHLKAYPKPFGQAETLFKNHDLQNIQIYSTYLLCWVCLGLLLPKWWLSLQSIINISLTQGYGYAELEAEERESSSDCWRSLLFSSWSMCASYSRSTTCRKSPDKTSKSEFASTNTWHTWHPLNSSSAGSKLESSHHARLGFVCGSRCAHQLRVQPLAPGKLGLHLCDLVSLGFHWHVVVSQTKLTIPRYLTSWSIILCHSSFYSNMLSSHCTILQGECLACSKQHQTNRNPLYMDIEKCFPKAPLCLLTLDIPDAITEWRLWDLWVSLLVGSSCNRVSSPSAGIAPGPEAWHTAAQRSSPAGKTMFEDFSASSASSLSQPKHGATANINMA